jgi:endonuclease/exonuclease/phosphatase family metal-dependent hydrolase
MDEPFLVIATHLHHIEAEHEPRLAQVPVLLDFWNGSPLSLILGDMNSLPGFPEMDLIAQAGFVDSWSEAGLGEGLSWPAADPFERIDWIWHTPDLAALEAETIDSTASDHRPVVVTLDVGS